MVDFSRRPRARRGDTAALPMSSLIDVVFLLLIFFVMTFQVVQPEGDIASVRMPQAANPTPTVELDVPIRVVLYADENGEPAGAAIGEVRVGSHEQLRTEIAPLLKRASRSGPVDITVLPAPQLRYQPLVDGVTAIKLAAKDVGLRETDLALKIGKPCVP